MRSTRAIPACAILLLVSGCTRKLGPPPALHQLQPSSMLGGQAKPVRVLGEHFSQRFIVDYAHPGHTVPQGGFTLELLSGSTAIALQGVAFVSEGELSATAGAELPVGAYALRLTDPWGRQATLANAFTVRPECAATSDCDDGVPCTQDVCEANRCRHLLAAGSCLIGGACRTNGEVNPANTCQGCDPATSTAAWTTWPDGHACDDGNGCTSGEHCTAGTCGNPTSTVSCPPPDGCHLAGTCNPATGACGPTPQMPDGTSCDDGYACTSPDTCQQGVCRGGPSSCVNTAPLACLTVTPTATTVGTPITFDASCSSDLEDSTNALLTGFAFKADGGFTPFSAAMTTTFSYSAPGLYTASVEVRDTGGLRTYASRFISVVNATQDVVVTTAADENDPNATPQSPGGTGLSLREAMAYTNASSTSQIIRFSGPMTLQPTSPLPPLTAPGAGIVGGPGVVLDFGLSGGDGGTGACIVLAGDDQHLLDLELLDCPGPTVQLQGRSDHVAECQIHRGTGRGEGLVLAGSGGVAGPRTRVFDFAGPGVRILASDNRVDGAQLFHNGVGVDVAGDAGITGIFVQGSELYGNAGAGVVIPPNPSGVHVWLDTLDGNGGPGVAAPSSDGGVDARDNLLTRNGAPGLCGPAGGYTNREPNGLFANDGGAFCEGSPDAGSILADPRYMAPSRGDFRLQPGSPAINAGADLGVDVNGPAPGFYTGSAPDLGANESPY